MGFGAVERASAEVAAHGPRELYHVYPSLVTGLVP